MLLTLTLPHDFGQALGELLASVRASFSALVSGRAWQENKKTFDLAHYVRAHDVTVGPNGWHPHLHIVLLGRRALSPIEVDALTNAIFERWRSAIVKLGHRAPSRKHGISLEQARTRSDLSRYVCQVVSGEKERPTPVALEVARGDLKASAHPDHRTPWQVLADFKDHGDVRDLWLFHEWEKATRGVHAIRWSKGLRQAVGLGNMMTDEEIVAQDVGGELVYTFRPLEWKLLIRKRGAMARVLDVAESGGAPAVSAFMDQLRGGLGWGLSHSAGRCVRNKGGRNRKCEGIPARITLLPALRRSFVPAAPNLPPEVGSASMVDGDEVRHQIVPSLMTPRVRAPDPLRQIRFRVVFLALVLAGGVPSLPPS